MNGIDLQILGYVGKERGNRVGIVDWDWGLEGCGRGDFGKGGKGRGEKRRRTQRERGDCNASPGKAIVPNMGILEVYLNRRCFCFRSSLS